MKAYTDIEQSKKLAEILPIESADMRYGYIAPYEFSDRMYDGGYDDIPYLKDFLKKNPNFSENEYDGEFPCWSLAALFSVLPEFIKFDGHTWKFLTDHCGTYYMNADTYDTNTFSTNNKNLVDDCYEMIIKLHEQKLL